MKATAKCWMYSKDFPQGRIFEEGEEIPQGFEDHPVKEPPKKKRGRPRKDERK